MEMNHMKKNKQTQKGSAYNSRASASLSMSSQPSDAASRHRGRPSSGLSSNPYAALADDDDDNTEAGGTLPATITTWQRLPPVTGM